MAAELTCNASEELLALSALGALDADDGATLDSHLRGCARCRAMGRDFQRAAAALPEVLELADPPASLRRRLLAEAYGDASARPRRGLAARLWQAIPQGRAFTIAAAGAAVAAVVLGVWGASRGAPTAPRTYSVVGTTSDPGVHGSLTYYASTADAVISVTGLPQPTAEAGSPAVYELWLIPSSGPPRGAAFLAESPLTGVWSGSINADLAPYVAIAATAEPSGGSPKPTGMQVLSVQLGG